MRPSRDDASVKAWLKGRVKPARLRHTQGVVRLAVKLAARHGLNAENARLAAWLHDCGKGLPPEEQHAAARRGGADAHELRQKNLWHAPAGAALARRAFGLRDRSLLAAIRFHTTGAPGLDALGMALCVADYAEAGRSYAGLRRLRRLAGRDLEAAYAEALRLKIAWVVESGQPLHPRTVAAYNDALLRLSER